MQKVKFIYYQEGRFYVGYLEEFPDYMTQGKTIKDLKENLRDLYKELTLGNTPYTKHVDELIIV